MTAFKVGDRVKAKPFGPVTLVGKEGVVRRIKAGERYPIYVDFSGDSNWPMREGEIELVDPRAKLAKAVSDALAVYTKAESALREFDKEQSKSKADIFVEKMTKANVGSVIKVIDGNSTYTKAADNRWYGKAGIGNEPTVFRAGAHRYEFISEGVSL